MFKPLSLSVALTSALLASQPASAEFRNESFSVFGAAGFEWVSYEEKIPNFGGYKVKSDFDAVNFVQRTGGYTAINEDWGFYITTASTLIAMERMEEWNASGFAGPVQQDMATMNFNTIDLTMAYHLHNGTYLTAGGHYQKIAFSRYDWRSTSYSNQFADGIESNIRNDAALMNQIATDVAAGKYTDISTVDEYMEAIRFSPEENQDVILEDAATFGAMVGVGYDSYFVDRNPGIRWLGSFEVGTVMYEHVLNTSNTRAMNKAFAGGLDARARLGVGYQFSKKFALMLVSDAHYSHRDAIKETTSEGTVSRPENTLTALSGYLSLSWNFKS
ncbi:hypothetical protein [Parathalassolituus penaei]|uniref:Uncharacterized protein n=1 Tax=Parathalassolituus penaei TaxID=2997323 RepID=A0A9X3EAT4_9GAMM|nr:hypothetical protein [Parathalassolituus penaei]MCY0963746.1 hypothetical protein [Parathalassolituus penaei]